VAVRRRERRPEERRCRLFNNILRLMERLGGCERLVTGSVLLLMG
jgi:hypothetical protein